MVGPPFDGGRFDPKLRAVFGHRDSVRIYTLVPTITLGKAAGYAVTATRGSFFNEPPNGSSIRVSVRAVAWPVIKYDGVEDTLTNPGFSVNNYLQIFFLLGKFV